MVRPTAEQRELSFGPVSPLCDSPPGETRFFIYSYHSCKGQITDSDPNIANPCFHTPLPIHTPQEYDPVRGGLGGR